jgi:hypothetical protein
MYGFFFRCIHDCNIQTPESDRVSIFVCGGLEKLSQCRGFAPARCLKLIEVVGYFFLGVLA